MEVKNSRSIYSELLELIHKKESCVLATVTFTQGSTPQKSGSSAIFGNQKILSGTVGGGITELQIEQIAAENIKFKKSGYYQFNLNNEISDSDAAICGGNMNVLIDAEPEKNSSVFETLNSCISNRISGVLITTFTNDKSGIKDLTRYWLTDKNRHIISEGIDQKLVAEAEEMLSKHTGTDHKELIISTGDKEKIAFLERIQPLKQLVIAGAGHIGKALSHLGKLLNFEVIVWDDRPDYANPEILPDADKIFTGSFKENLKNFQFKDSYIVIATRGHKNDADVLKQIIGSNAGYIGMIGSRKKIAQIRETSIEDGWATKEQWDKIHAPIGIKIGSKSVQEIAVSIAAQLIQVRDQNRKE